MTSHDLMEIYTSADGSIEIQVQFDQDTVWLSQAQLVGLFERDVSVISRHIRNALNEGEVSESNLQKMQIANSDKPVTLYDLDVVISVGYRVKSTRGVQFRRWATQRLREYLVQGYALNQQRFDQNAAELQQAIALIRKAAQAPDINATTGRGLVEIVSRYTQTFLWLQRYDEGLLNDPQGQTGGDLPTPEIAMQALQQLKQVLMARGEATALFAHPREDGLSAIFGNLNQSVFGESAYPTIESCHQRHGISRTNPLGC